MHSSVPTCTAWRRESPRLFGINLDYTEVVVPIHAVWSAAVPILLAELLFPARRVEPWLSRVGLVVTTCMYLLGVVIVAFGAHTQLDPGDGRRRHCSGSVSLLQRVSA